MAGTREAGDRALAIGVYAECFSLNREPRHTGGGIHRLAEHQNGQDHTGPEDLTGDFFGT